VVLVFSREKIFAKTEYGEGWTLAWRNCE